jgi:uncharacterized membrane protein
MKAVTIGKPVTIGLAVIAGAALFEAALIPGALIGAAALLAPKLLSPARTRRRPPPLAVKATVKASGKISDKGSVSRATISPTKLALFKTITFRVIATSVDFTSNIIVIGSLAPAATISAYGLIAGPLFYFGHELFWQRRKPTRTTVDIAALPRPRATALSAPALLSRPAIRLDRALVKTITYRAIVTTTDFTANFVISGNLPQAVILTSFGFFAGPFIYYGHEKAWDRFGPKVARPTAI